VTDDEDIRELVGRAHETDPDQVEVDLASGLSEVRGRAGQQDLSARQREILALILTSIDRLGYPPSVREIGEAVGLSSVSAVAHQLRALERKGYLRRDPNRPRAIGILPSDVGALPE
jgi:repressor LexA